MQVHLKTLGCRLNEAELEAWSRGFRARGHQITPMLSEADLVVINTCAVTGEAVRKSRKLMRRAGRDNPRAKLVVSGCFASLNPGETAQALGVDLVVENADKDRLVEIAERTLDLEAMPELATLPGEYGLPLTSRQRAFIKVQDGCRYQCTFCVVTQARGKERSVDPNEIVEIINAFYDQGVQEVVLTGVHIGGYGNDLDSNLSKLIGRVLSETDIPRLRLGAVEPWDLPESFWALFNNPRFMPHLHLPLQSGADSVLRRMARRCKVDEFQRLVNQARRHIPHFNVTTDIIVGFPGETNREWQQTMETVSNIGFGHLHIFAYSTRPGTRAASLPGQVSKEIIRTRSRELHELGKRLTRETLRQYTGHRMPVLIEGDPSSNDADRSGYTPNFLKVSLEDNEGRIPVNQIRMVELYGISESGGELLGKIVPEAWLTV